MTKTVTTDTNATELDLTLMDDIQAAMNAEPGYMLVSTDDAQDLILAGYVEQNAAVSEGNKFATRLTVEGQAYLASLPQEAETSQAVDPAQPTPQPTVAPVQAATPVTPKAKLTFEIDDNIPLPASMRGKREGGYPFDKLEAGQSFHIPVTAEDAEPWKSVSSSCSAATDRYKVPTGDNETVEQIIYKVDAEGTRVKENGHWVKLGTKQVTRPAMKKTREFVAREAPASDPRGAGARVYRVS